MNIAVATVCSDGYVIFLEHFIKSILKHNPDFDKDFWIIYSDFDYMQLSIYSIERLDKLYPFKYHKVDYELYKKFNKEHPKYFSHDLFLLKGYDRVIYWGSDMLCVKQLDELWKVADGIEDIGMPKERRRGGDIPYNNGSMIVNSKYLNVDTYKKIMNAKYDQHKCHLKDQKIYNLFFKDNIKEIHLKFNTLVSELDFIPYEEILILHYIYKPTQVKGVAGLSNCSNGYKSLEEWKQYD